MLGQSSTNATIFPFFLFFYFLKLIFFFIKYTYIYIFIEEKLIKYLVYPSTFIKKIFFINTQLTMQKKKLIEDIQWMLNVVKIDDDD